jgi:ADP-ribose pyrophosphatase YjhB (NUDIX family)
MIKTKSAGGVVINNKGQVLVVSQYGTSWSLPKGHIQENEDELTAAKREIHEESGITDLHLVRKLGTYSRFRIGKDPRYDDQTELKEITIYFFKTNQEGLSPLDVNNPEAKWVEKEDVADILTNEKDRAFYSSIMDQLN